VVKSFSHRRRGKRRIHQSPERSQVSACMPWMLAELDIVIASPHVALKQDESKATDRILRAIESRYVNIIGHPPGRLIDRREGLPLAIGKVVRTAAANGTALEITAGYPRLDLNDVHARAATGAGCMLCVNTDAHSIEELPGIGFGIDVARRAWAGPSQIVNCMSWPQLQQFLARKR